MSMRDEGIVWVNGMHLQLRRPVTKLAYVRAQPGDRCETCGEENMVLYVYNLFSHEAETYCPACYEGMLLFFLNELRRDFPQLKGAENGEGV